jgi:hypothetical protein
MSDSDQTKGLYRKFLVLRTDGSSEPGGKHDGCECFVLDITHDKYAAPALLAYAEACDAEYPELAKDIRANLVSSPLVNGPTGEEAAPATKES